MQHNKSKFCAPMMSFQHAWVRTVLAGGLYKSFRIFTKAPHESRLVIFTDASGDFLTSIEQLLNFKNSWWPFIRFPFAKWPHVSSLTNLVFTCLLFAKVFSCTSMWTSCSLKQQQWLWIKPRSVSVFWSKNRFYIHTIPLPPHSVSTNVSS